MKTIIAGSREGIDKNDLLIALAVIDWEVTEVVCGMARGADLIGKKWAEEQGIPVIERPADWEKYGRTLAGAIRNQQMADEADALIALWDGKSPGTKNMIEIATREGLKVLTYERSRRGSQ